MGLINISTPVKDAISCKLGENVLAASTGFNTPDKSIIGVDKKQCFLVTCTGKIMELCAATGNFRYDQTRESSCIAGTLPKVAKTNFEQFKGRRNQEGDKKVIFINIDTFEMDFDGTDRYPVLIKDDVTDLELHVNLGIKAKYSFRISDPALFYKFVCGDIEGDFSLSEVAPQIHVEVGTAFLGASMRLPEYHMDYYKIDSYKKVIADLMKEEIQQRWEDFRGISLESLEITDFVIDGDMSGFEKMRKMKQLMQESEWTCECGTLNKGNFCINCGKPRR